ncbi:dephospho-CoA kinase [Aequorivita viscosa]|uniref:Dephospho-CoA kinase n=1 Tax=Aequorivita viscosa TaxID=797419 RepID=A0A1M6ITA9_9FLAO|nr:dephospho-CoA kinase [Aequorivita viscosa]SDX14098.1 dephospho-CoA kinase [Aequorivita viscosa]SHJ37703.1 dephospho-CoA kinase [Aequorivita viscosa]
MKIIGLTGGIGSGKTTVAKMFAELGIPVYNSDVEAKILTNTSEAIRKELILLLGDETYKNGKLDRKFLADKIFNDKVLLQKVNAIIHPKVGEHFKNWVANQTAPYVIKEAAILFESGSNVQCDLVILVTASKKERIRRVMDRDQVSKTEVEARMNNQWNDSEKIKLSNFVIQNETLPETKMQVETIHSQLI